jgi:hypothetical protein
LNVTGLGPSVAALAREKYDVLCIFSELLNASGFISKLNIVTSTIPEAVTVPLLQNLGLDLGHTLTMNGTSARIAPVFATQFNVIYTFLTFDGRKVSLPAL